MWVCVCVCVEMIQSDKKADQWNGHTRESRCEKGTKDDEGDDRPSTRTPTTTTTLILSCLNDSTRLMMMMVAVMIKNDSEKWMINCDYLSATSFRQLTPSSNSLMILSVDERDPPTVAYKLVCVCVCVRIGVKKTTNDFKKLNLIKKSARWMTSLKERERFKWLEEKNKQNPAKPIHFFRKLKGR